MPVHLLLHSRVESEPRLVHLGLGRGEASTPTIGDEPLDGRTDGTKVPWRGGRCSGNFPARRS